MAKHREVHPSPIPDCFGCHMLEVNIGGFPTEGTDRERRWDKDMPSYKRMRDGGLQPRQIDGCAELESRASDQFEVEMGHLIPAKDRERIKEGFAVAREIQEMQETTS